MSVNLPSPGQILTVGEANRESTIIRVKQGAAMARSVLQDAFMKELVIGFKATLARIERRMQDCGGNDEITSVVRDELRGLYHGILVTFDGGTSLAEKGLIRIVDEDDNAFDRYLHELCFDYWPDDE